MAVTLPRQARRALRRAVMPVRLGRPLAEAGPFAQAWALAGALENTSIVQTAAAAIDIILSMFVVPLLFQTLLPTLHAGRRLTLATSWPSWEIPRHDRRFSEAHRPHRRMVRSLPELILHRHLRQGVPVNTQ